MPNDKILAFLDELDEVPQDTIDATNETVEKKDTSSKEEELVSVETVQHPSFTKYYAIKKLIDLFLETEQGEKSKGRKKILELCEVLIWVILIFEIGLIVFQGLGHIKLDKVTFLGTIGTITSGIVFLLKIVTKSLYNDESDKVLKTVETIINKL